MSRLIVLALSLLLTGCTAGWMPDLFTAGVAVHDGEVDSDGNATLKGKPVSTSLDGDVRGITVYAEFTWKLDHIQPKPFTGKPYHRGSDEPPKPEDHGHAHVDQYGHIHDEGKHHQSD